MLVKEKELNNLSIHVVLVRNLVVFIKGFLNLFKPIVPRLSIHKVILFLLDLTCLFASIGIAYTFYFQTEYFTNEIELWISLSFFALGYIVLFEEYGLYKYQSILDKSRHVTQLQKAFLNNILLTVFVAFLVGLNSFYINKWPFLIACAILIVSLTFFRVLLIPSIFFWMVDNKIIEKKLLIIGIGDFTVNNKLKLILSNKSYFKVCGFLDDNEAQSSISQIPRLGSLEEIKSVVDEYKITDILVASNYKDDQKLHHIIDLCKEANRTLHITSELYNIVTKKIDIDEIGTISTFRFYPSREASLYNIFKRALDISVTLLFIIALLPIWLLIMLIIKIDSSGPVFYKAKVIGKNGQKFRMFKFRSMYHNCSTEMHRSKVQRMIKENGTTHKIKKDPRITRVGHFLRKTSLDEFPQLLNVLKGDMSLVGPRPMLPYEYDVMKNWQKNRFSVMPGMTGLWQIKGRNEVLFSDQIVLDLYYIENRSLKFDLKILFDTLPVVLLGRGGG